MFIIAAKTAVASPTKCVSTLIWLLRCAILVVFAGTYRRTYNVLPYTGHLDGVVDALGMLSVLHRSVADNGML